MANKPKHLAGINFNSKGSIRIGGDVVGRDKITHEILSPKIDLEKMMKQWEKIIFKEVNRTLLPSDEKGKIKNQITAIKSVVVQDKGKNLKGLEKLINTLAIMSPDIFDVVVATLANPLAGIGLTIRKISNKVKLETQTRESIKG